MTDLLLPALFAGLFVAGCIAIRAAARWSELVTDALSYLCFALAMILACTWSAGLVRERPAPGGEPRLALHFAANAPFYASQVGQAVGSPGGDATTETD